MRCSEHEPRRVTFPTSIPGAFVEVARHSILEGIASDHHPDSIHSFCDPVGVGFPVWIAFRRSRFARCSGYPP